MLRGVVFDYGGTIDTNGLHWAHVIWQGYCKAALPISWANFRLAYVFAERSLALHPYIQPHHDFLDMLRIKVALQFDYILDKHLNEGVWKNDSADVISKYCDDYARRCIERTLPVLTALKGKYPLVLVSNFYGNIQRVLDVYGLSDFFPNIVESAVVGIRKPDPRIFALGVERLGLSNEEVVVIGDSYEKDILPASSLGCSTIWIKGRGWNDDETDGFDSIFNTTDGSFSHPALHFNESNMKQQCGIMPFHYTVSDFQQIAPILGSK